MNDEKTRTPDDRNDGTGTVGGAAQSKNEPPAAGPHARPDLSNPDSTPGAGTISPDAPAGDGDMDATG